MSQKLAELIGQEVPYLRRYARALTGSQDSGDAYVIATIEAITDDPSNFARTIPVRTALYRVFLKIWNSVPLNEYTAAPVDDKTLGAQADGTSMNGQRAYFDTQHRVDGAQIGIADCRDLQKRRCNDLAFAASKAHCPAKFMRSERLHGERGTPRVSWRGIGIAA